MKKTETETQAEGLMTANQVCQRLQVCRTTLTHLVALRPVRIGRAVRWPRGEVDAYMSMLARARDGLTGPGRPRTGDST